MIQNVNMAHLLKKMSDHHCIKDYLFVMYGKLDQDMVISMIQLIEKKMKLEKFSKSIITRVKLLSIEILQNIVKHQEKHNEIFPYFILGTKQEDLTIYSGNVINSDDKTIIDERLSKFIALDDENFRDNYKKALQNAVVSSEGNVGIGLLDIVYRSHKNLSYHIDHISPNLYTFNLNVSIHS